MRPRATNDLARLPDSQLLEQAAAGLRLVAEHATRLHSAALALDSPEHLRGALALLMIAEEEASKYLILLDAIRCPRRPEGVLARQLNRFGDHLAKGIYVEVCGWRPATFGELQQSIDCQRDTFYMDGPNEEWVFRNEIVQRREDALYVDYVEGEGEHWWTSPQRWESQDPLTDTRLHNTPVLDLVGALNRSGFSEPRALRIVADRWRTFATPDDLHVRLLCGENERTLDDLQEGQLLKTSDPRDLWRICERWPFPLHSLKLERRAVKTADLQKRREQRSGVW